MPAACVVTNRGLSMSSRSRPAAAPVTLADVTKTFGGVVALDHVSATIAPGQLVAVIGRSGAGKITLLRCMSGATALDAGRVLFGALDLARLRGARRRAHRARVGMIYQQFNLAKRLRVIDNVRIGRLPFLRGWRRWAVLARYFDAEETAVALRCLGHVGLAARVWQRADTLRREHLARISRSTSKAGCPGRAAVR